MEREMERAMNMYKGAWSLDDSSSAQHRSAWFSHCHLPGSLTVVLQTWNDESWCENEISRPDHAL